ncbi:LytTR family DNA-binding domain-containing protein [Ferruginibacter lapsinanis]|uniref:LytR/AlgR family response regulator transcription factor n=1 Tax=Ferruginibacter lapsinanis TaxID=563172 RepID=UPI001E4BD4F5|nr:LytTR family DNA-binding domain-containing protein [Ferruginibacter lapsinanis]UEG48923.1 LytTR family DNA-binding domain-containing protein [Ferruginibacter lapsinanis]
MKAIIIDDEPLARMVIREYLQSHDDITVLQECNDGFEGVKAIMQHQPDLIFLDIQMPKINGFEMLELIDQPPAVIFTTAFEEYAIKAFETHAVDYLLKPFSKDRFDKALQKLQEGKESNAENTKQLLEAVVNTPDKHNRIVVKENGKIKIIPLTQIQFIEAADDYVKVHTAEGYFLKNKTMAYFESVLDPNSFIRIHRSYIVNVQLITRLDPYEKETYVAVLSNGKQLPVSKTGYAKLKEVLGI